MIKSLLLVGLSTVALGLATALPAATYPTGTADPTTAASANPSPTADPSPAAVVRTKNFAYKPPVVTVKVGDTVEFVNDDETPHTVTSSDDPKAFDSGNMDQNQKFYFTFKAAGTYTYFCAYHSYMKAKVVVVAPK